MMNFLQKILALFSKPRYQTGALESPVDPRNIELASFMMPVALPMEYETDMPPVENQGGTPKCVGCAIHKAKELYLKEKGIYVDLSDDDLYEQCKAADGYPDIAGTFPALGAKIACNVGIASVQAYNTHDKTIIEASRAKNKLGNYAFVVNDYDSVCQAIYQKKHVCASFAVDTNWFMGIITKVLTSIGRHYVILHGFRRQVGTVIGQNSWGIEWIGKVAGLINSNVKPGHFELLWTDYTGNVIDLISFTDVPDEILKKATIPTYRFTKNLKYGDKGYDVVQLQERMRAEGYFVHPASTGFYGDQTRLAVISYQMNNGIPPTGNCYELTRAKLNEKASSMLDLWALAIQTHEGYYLPGTVAGYPNGSRSYKNCSPANFKVGATLTNYMKKLGAIGLDKDNFVIFPNYETGFNALKSFLADAATGKLLSYKPEMTLVQFFSVYAPSSDGNSPTSYAQFVAGRLKVYTSTTIRELV